MEAKMAIVGSDTSIPRSAYSEIKKACPKLQTPFISTPPTIGVTQDVMMRNLSDFVINTIKNSTVKTNLTRSQITALKSLKQKQNIHFSVSDKRGEFVIATAEAYKCLTIEHIKSNNSVYQWVRPTRHRLGTTSYVKYPTEVTYRNQINSKRDSIKDQCNGLWSEIVEARGIEKKFAALFYAHNTTLPTLYTLVKTQKIPPGVDITSKSLEELKVRPIVSCSGSPSEKLATLVTKIITPLLDFIPCHLKNIHEHLEIFKRINPNELLGLRFYTADVSALFTNVSVNSCIEDVIELAAEYWADIQTYGLELVDLHRLLEIVLGSSYFKFNGRLYNQIYGVFIGCAASPPCAIIKLYKLEKESIYTDAYYLTNPV